MKRWIVLLAAVVLLFAMATSAFATPIHVGGGPMLTATSSPGSRGLAVGRPAWVVLPAHAGGGSVTLRSPIHVGGGPE